MKKSLLGAASPTTLPAVFQFFFPRQKNKVGPKPTIPLLTCNLWHSTAVQKDAGLLALFAFLCPHSGMMHLIQCFLSFNCGHALIIELHPGNGIHF